MCVAPRPPPPPPNLPRRCGMLIAGTFGPHTALNTLVTSTIASAAMCGVTIAWFSWSSGRGTRGGAPTEAQEPCSVGLVSVWKGYSYGAAVYSAAVLLVAGSSPPGWFPRDALMPALVGGWSVAAGVAAVGYAMWRAAHPVAAAAPAPAPAPAQPARLSAVVAGGPPAPGAVPPLYDLAVPWGDMNTVPGYPCCAWTSALAAV